MLEHPIEVATEASKLDWPASSWPASSWPASSGQASSWQPVFEVISLACEISAYAPDEGRPLF